MENWMLIVIGVVIALIALFWLIRSASGRSPESVTRDGVPQEISPFIAGGAVTPADIPPPVDAVPLAPEPEALVQPPVHPIPAGPADELTRMKGVGPKVAAMLNGLGITRFDQIAAWSDADLERVDDQLGAFKGRAVRDQWIDQARLLAAGDTVAYEARFGKLG